MELLIGCGHSRTKKIHTITGGPEWQQLVTLDHNPDCNPDVVHDLEDLPLPFPDESFDEIHAYCVLEHCGSQGDWRGFFDQWAEFWRLLVPGGLFCGLTPHYTSPWAWGDPSHTRIISRECLTFLSQTEYESAAREGRPMTDFRRYWVEDFTLLWCEVTKRQQFGFVLKKG